MVEKVHSSKDWKTFRDQLFPFRVSLSVLLKKNFCEHTHTHTHTARIYNMDTDTHAFHCNLHLMSTHFTCCPDYRCQKLSVRACGDLGDGRVDSEECAVGLKAKVRRQIPSPPAALQWTWLSISLRPVSSFALLVFPNSCCLSLLFFLLFSPLTGQSTNWIGFIWWRWEYGMVCHNPTIGSQFLKIYVVS